MRVVTFLSCVTDAMVLHDPHDTIHAPAEVPFDALQANTMIPLRCCASQCRPALPARPLLPHPPPQAEHRLSQLQARPQVLQQSLQQPAAPSLQQPAGDCWIPGGRAGRPSGEPWVRVHRSLAERGVSETIIHGCSCEFSLRTVT